MHPMKNAPLTKRKVDSNVRENHLPAATVANAFRGHRCAMAKSNVHMVRTKWDAIHHYPHSKYKYSCLNWSIGLNDDIFPYAAGALNEHSDATAVNVCPNMNSVIRESLAKMAAMNRPICVMRKRYHRYSNGCSPMRGPAWVFIVRCVARMDDVVPQPLYVLVEMDAVTIQMKTHAPCAVSIFSLPYMSQLDHPCNL